MFMPILGLTQGAQLYLIGSPLMEPASIGRVKETFRNCCQRAGTAIAVTGWLAVHIWISQIIGLFTRDDLGAYKSDQILCYKIYFLMFPVIGFFRL